MTRARKAQAHEHRSQRKRDKRRDKRKASRRGRKTPSAIAKAPAWRLPHIPPEWWGGVLGSAGSRRISRKVTQ